MLVLSLEFSLENISKIHSNIVGVFKNNSQSLPTATMTREFDVFLQKPVTQENVLPLTPKLQEVKKCIEGLCICLVWFPLPFTELITHHKLVLSPLPLFSLHVYKHFPSSQQAPRTRETNYAHSVMIVSR